MATELYRTHREVQVTITALPYSPTTFIPYSYGPSFEEKPSFPPLKRAISPESIYRLG